MLNSGNIDLSTCLIHQKLQMLAICIGKKSKMEKDLHKSSEGDARLDGHPTQMSDSLGSDGKCDSPLRSDVSLSLALKTNKSSPDSKSVSSSESPTINLPDQIRKGSAGTVGSMMLLNSYQQMHAPYTQDPPIMTEDMHEERLRAVEAFGNDFSFSAQLEKDILSSDMSAFKAANPGAVFEDFIRWHSPGDWEDDVVDKVSSKLGNEESNWPPGGRLSQRMSEGGNSWRQIWNESPALPASEQKPLLDPNREGEKILHYLETLQPHQLLEQMVCTAFKASADSLSQTSFGNLQQMAMKIEQLYLTMASTLKPLQASHLKDKGEMIDDLNRLCNVFEHVEKLLFLAASIHRKLLNAPRLCKAIFGDYYNFYLPRMGTSLIDIANNSKEFTVRQPVGISERQVVTSLFTTPTANQSWRKVLSMGNLLNGHEPILREIIFSVYDNVGEGHYATATRAPHQQIETHRMYISGTSNDLSAALAVTSCD